MKRPVKPAQADEGYSLLVCNKPGRRRLDDFDVAQSMQEIANEDISCYRTTFDQ